MQKREKIINDYVAGYNTFDIEKVAADFDENIKFTSIINGEVTLLIKGLNIFEKHVTKKRASSIVISRKIKSFKHHRAETEIEIESFTIISLGLHEVEKVKNVRKLQSRIIFKFKGTKIIEVIDIS